MPHSNILLTTGAVIPSSLPATTWSLLGRQGRNPAPFLEDGVDLLGDLLGVGRQAVEVVSGAASRDKLVEVRGIDQASAEPATNSTPRRSMVWTLTPCGSGIGSVDMRKFQGSVNHAIIDNDASPVAFAPSMGFITKTHRTAWPSALDALCGTLLQIKAIFP